MKCKQARVCRDEGQVNLSMEQLESRSALQMLSNLPRQVGEIAKIVQSFTGAKNVRIKNMLDPSLVAGFTMKFGSNLIDFSLKSELEKLASQIGADQKLPMLGH